MDNVVVLERELWQTGLDVPELYGVVARRASEDVLGGGVEEDMADLPVAVLDANLDRAHRRTSCGRSAWRQARHQRAPRHRCAG